MVEAQMVQCPHCGQSNPWGGAYCEHCGKAMPQTGSGPRVVGESEFATSASGQAAQSEELSKRARSASVALLAVAILMTVGIALIYFLLGDMFDDPEMRSTAVGMLIAQCVLAAVYYGLWWWARTSPLPAAIVGLVIFITIWVANALLDPSQAFAGIIVKAIVIVVLIRAIQAGLQHRRLKEQMAGS